MRTLLAALMLAATAALASAQNIGDRDRGHTFAVLVCAECHAIESGEGTSPNEDAPTFTTVAGTPGMSELALTVFFQTPHVTMPNIILPSDVARDLIAYILSLED